MVTAFDRGFHIFQRKLTIAFFLHSCFSLLHRSFLFVGPAPLLQVMHDKELTTETHRITAHAPPCWRWRTPTCRRPWSESSSCTSNGSKKEKYKFVGLDIEYTCWVSN